MWAGAGVRPIATPPSEQQTPNMQTTTDLDTKPQKKSSLPPTQGGYSDSPNRTGIGMMGLGMGEWDPHRTRQTASTPERMGCGMNQLALTSQMVLLVAHGHP